MDAVQRLLLLVAQRRGVVTIDLGFKRDVVMTFKAREAVGSEPDDQRTVCEADVEGAADKLASEIAGESGSSGRRP